MTLTELNALDKTRLHLSLIQCCGSGVWVEKMCAGFPLKDEQELFELAGKKWLECGEKDWKEAFSYHPKIGDLAGLQKSFQEATNGLKENRLL